MDLLGTVGKLLGGETLSAIKGVASKFIGDPAEQQKFELEMQQVLQQRESEIEETLRQRMTMTAEVIKAEMAQGDKFTKRARPMLVYWGMVLVTLHTFASWVKGVPDLPDQFWIAWGGVVSVWIAGRSAEKFRGKGKTDDNPLIKAITG